MKKYILEKGSLVNKITALLVSPLFIMTLIVSCGESKPEILPADPSEVSVNKIFKEISDYKEKSGIDEEQLLSRISSQLGKSHKDLFFEKNGAAKKSKIDYKKLQKEDIEAFKLAVEKVIAIEKVIGEYKSVYNNWNGKNIIGYLVALLTGDNAVYSGSGTDSGKLIAPVEFEKSLKSGTIDIVKVTPTIDKLNTFLASKEATAMATAKNAYNAIVKLIDDAVKGGQYTVKQILDEITKRATRSTNGYLLNFVKNASNIVLKQVADVQNEVYFTKKNIEGLKTVVDDILKKTPPPSFDAVKFYAGINEKINNAEIKVPGRKAIIIQKLKNEGVNKSYTNTSGNDLKPITNLTTDLKKQKALQLLDKAIDKIIVEEEKLKAEEEKLKAEYAVSYKAVHEEKEANTIRDIIGEIKSNNDIKSFVNKASKGLKTYEEIQKITASDRKKFFTLEQINKLLNFINNTKSVLAENKELANKVYHPLQSDIKAIADSDSKNKVIGDIKAQYPAFIDEKNNLKGASVILAVPYATRKVYFTKDNVNEIQKIFDLATKTKDNLYKEAIDEFAKLIDEEKQILAGKLKAKMNINDLKLDDNGQFGLLMKDTKNIKALNDITKHDKLKGSTGALDEKLLKTLLVEFKTEINNVTTQYMKECNEIYSNIKAVINEKLTDPKQKQDAITELSKKAPGLVKGNSLVDKLPEGVNKVKKEKLNSLLTYLNKIWYEKIIYSKFINLTKEERVQIIQSLKSLGVPYMYIVYDEQSIYPDSTPDCTINVLTTLHNLVMDKEQAKGDAKDITKKVEIYNGIVKSFNDAVAKGSDTIRTHILRNIIRKATGSDRELSKFIEYDSDGSSIALKLVANIQNEDYFTEKNINRLKIVVDDILKTLPPPFDAVKFYAGINEKINNAETTVTGRKAIIIEKLKDKSSKGYIVGVGLKPIGKLTKEERQKTSLKGLQNDINSIIAEEEKLQTSYSDLLDSFNKKGNRGAIFEELTEISFFRNDKSSDLKTYEEIQKSPVLERKSSFTANEINLLKSKINNISNYLLLELAYFEDYDRLLNDIDKANDKKDEIIKTVNGYKADKLDNFFKSNPKTKVLRFKTSADIKQESLKVRKAYFTFKNLDKIQKIFDLATKTVDALYNEAAAKFANLIDEEKELLAKNLKRNASIGGESKLEEDTVFELLMKDENNIKTLDDIKKQNVLKDGKGTLDEELLKTLLAEFKTEITSVTRDYMKECNEIYSNIKTVVNEKLIDKLKAEMITDISKDTPSLVKGNSLLDKLPEGVNKIKKSELNFLFTSISTLWYEYQIIVNFNSLSDLSKNLVLSELNKYKNLSIFVDNASGLHEFSDVSDNFKTSTDIIFRLDQLSKIIGEKVKEEDAKEVELNVIKNTYIKMRKDYNKLSSEQQVEFNTFLYDNKPSYDFLSNDIFTFEKNYSKILRNILKSTKKSSKINYTELHKFMTMNQILSIKSNLLNAKKKLDMIYSIYLSDSKLYTELYNIVKIIQAGDTKLFSEFFDSFNLQITLSIFNISASRSKFALSKNLPKSYTSSDLLELKRLIIRYYYKFIVTNEFNILPESIKTKIVTELKTKGFPFSKFVLDKSELYQNIPLLSVTISELHDLRNLIRVKSSIDSHKIHMPDLLYKGILSSFNSNNVLYPSKVDKDGKPISLDKELSDKRRKLILHVLDSSPKPKNSYSSISSGLFLKNSTLKTTNDISSDLSNNTITLENLKLLKKLVEEVNQKTADDTTLRNLWASFYENGNFDNFTKIISQNEFDTIYDFGYRELGNVHTKYKDPFFKKSSLVSNQYQAVLDIFRHKFFDDYNLFDKFMRVTNKTAGLDEAQKEYLLIAPKDISKENKTYLNSVLLKLTDSILKAKDDKSLQDAKENLTKQYGITFTSKTK